MASNDAIQDLEKGEATPQLSESSTLGESSTKDTKRQPSIDICGICDCVWPYY